MNDVERAMRAADRGRWCSQLSCTTCPREQWSDAFWALGNGVRLDVMGRPITPPIAAKPEAWFLDGCWPLEVQKRLMENLQQVRLSRLCEQSENWWLYLGLLWAVLGGLDRSARGFTDWVVPELLTLVPPGSDVARSLCELHDDLERRLELEHLWAVVVAGGERTRPRRSRRRGHALAA